MTTQIISDVNFTDPTNLIPYLEKDDAIIRGVTKFMYDFSNPATLNLAGAIPSGQVANSLTSDGGNGALTGALAALSGGMLDVGGTTGKAWALPATAKLPNTVRRFLAIVWAKVPAAGWQTGSSSVIESLMGYMSNTSSLAQWGLAVGTVQATGLPAYIAILTPTNAGVGSQDSIPEALAYCDGNLHQFALYFDGESAPGSRTRALYADKALVKSFTGAWDSTVNVPAAGANLGVNTAFQANYAAGAKLGRCSMWDLTGTAWTPAQILQRDWDAAAGYQS